MIEPAPGRAFVLVLDRTGRFLDWVTADYANRALLRNEVERTDKPGTVIVADGCWNKLDGNGKPIKEKRR